MNTYEQLVSEIQGETIIAYQNASLLGLFQGVDIGDIGLEKWFHKNMTDIPDAALTLAGFNPSEAKLNADLFSHTILTAAESLTISEKEMKQFGKWGLDADGIAALGMKVGETSTMYLFRGVDMEGVATSGEANNIFHAGAGTLASPSIISTATNGVWGTYANKVIDCYKIVGDLIAAGHNVGSSVLFYPKSAHASMNGRGTDEMSAVQMLLEQGVLGVVPIDDIYLWTLAAATPTNALFDMLLVDMSKVKIGYTRSETTNVIGPHDVVRDTVAECEVWFTPYLVPVPKNGAITKGVSRISAIAQA